MSEDEIIAREVGAVGPAKPPRLKGRITAEEIYETLKDILAGRAARPVTLVDTGEGDTIETYRIGMARVRIAVR